MKLIQLPKVIFAFWRTKEIRITFIIGKHRTQDKVPIIFSIWAVSPLIADDAVKLVTSQAIGSPDTL
jgi:hypothetical protein